MGPYENPSAYFEEFDEEQAELDRRERMIDKALKMAKLNTTEDEPADINSEEVVEAAKQFDEFVTKDSQ